MDKPAVGIGVALALGLALPAQTGFVSPAGFASRGGGWYEFWPWNNTGRRQQVHGDVQGPPQTITGIAWRRSGWSAEPRSRARTVDAEIGIGEADFGAVGTAFAANYVGPRVTAFVRKPLNLPDWSFPQVNRTEFTAPAPFDVPFSYSGTRDLAWDLKVHANSVVDYYFVDAHFEANTRSGQTTFYGAGCRVGGTGIPLLLETQVESSIQPDRVRMAWQCHHLPRVANNPSAFLFGTTNPDLSVPGLCTKIFADALLTLGVPAVDGVMRFDLVLPFTNALVGAAVHAQAIGYDVTQAGLPYVLSNGTTTAAAILPTPMRVHSVLSYLAAEADSGGRTAFSGVIVQFRTP